MPATYFEDLTIGDARSYGRVVIDRDEMVEFARHWDPQPFHLDEEAAKHSFVGRLIASGWFVACQHMRIMTEDTLPNPGIMGGTGIEELKWLRPVVAGDVLTGRRTILDKRRSASKPDRGLVQTLFEMVDAEGVPVMSQRTWEMFASKTMDRSKLRPLPLPAAGNPDARPDGPLTHHLGYFEDLAVGEVMPLGERHFPYEEIAAFARQWDPQTFHIDREAAKSSQYGGIIASGWHTGCAFMGCMARARAAMLDEIEAREGRVPVLGPSPGMNNLRWLKPTREGDTIRYFSQMLDKRLSASRPGWGIVTNESTGWNQHGERVFEVTSAIFWECRPT